MASDYRNLTDEALVARLRRARGEEERRRVCEALFWRYYGDIDRWVRRVLERFGKTYSDQQQYYNDVFMKIYRAVFEPTAFTRRLETFDESRGRFSRWLRQVVRNATIDWVRGQAVQPTETPAEVAREAAPAAPDLPHAERLVRQLAELADNERIALRLILIAYTDLTPEDVEVLSTRRQVTREALERQAGALRGRLQDQDRYRESLLAEDAQSALQYEVRVRERHAEAAAEALRRNGLSALQVDELKDDALRLTITEVRSRRTARVRGPAEASSTAHQEAEFQEAVIRLERAQRRFHDQRDVLSRGKHIVRASYRQVAAVMGVEETDVTNYVHRARLKLTRRNEN